jgi:ketosteroid isomerase-like protein
MKKKNGFNIILFDFIIILFLNLSCSTASKKCSGGELLHVDSVFSAMSEKEGMFKAFMFFIAEDGVILRDDSFPDIGRVSLARHFSGKSDTSFILSWEPIFENISESRDIGYTYGIYTNTDKISGEIMKGTYVTIWKRQKDGKWKFVLDSGTQGLPEMK